MPPSRIRRAQIVVEKSHEGKRLDQALAELLPAASGLPLSKGKIRKLIVAGAVYMNRGRVRIASKPVRTGMRIEVHIDEEKLRSSSEGEGPTREWKPADLEIVHEDEWIFGVNKPAGLPTQPTLDEARANLYMLLKKRFEYVGLHHRLDRDTSGVMLFTKKKEVNAEVGKLFQAHLARKTYLAIVSVKERRGESGSRVLSEEWTVENYLAREKGKAGKMRSVRSGGDAAQTDFRLLAQEGAYALVEARPRTGRMHQIRVHLSEAGTPIVGDRAYGGEVEIDKRTVPRVMLHAAELRFPHPHSKTEVVFRASPPEDFISIAEGLRLDALR